MYTLLASLDIGIVAPAAVVCIVGYMVIKGLTASKKKHRDAAEKQPVKLSLASTREKEDDNALQNWGFFVHESGSPRRIEPEVSEYEFTPSRRVAHTHG